MPIQYPLNKSYTPKNELYNKMIDVSQSLGKATREATPAPSPTPTSAPQQTGGISQYQNIPKTLSDLGTQTTPYGGSTRYEPGGTHMGVDIANKMGTPIPSFTGGTVTDVRTGKVQGDKGYGNYVIVTTPQGEKVRYSHLSNNFVSVGQELSSGDVLGTMGNTGSTYSQFKNGTGSHLDLRIQDAYGKFISPISYISSH